ncbi:MAG: GTP 3',8-cyclase MoaA [Planctomycetes bacterium]|nr:GTP 3',8-cyclase MoaA [Planctomycetota bacterium]
MLDQFGREIDNLRISVTDRCNLKCFYCMPGEGDDFWERDRLLSWDEILRVVDVVTGLGFRDFRVTGGEPLLRPGIDDFLLRLKRHRGVRKVSITTNGILLAGRIPFLKEIGVEHINVSLDTFRPDRFAAITRGGDCARVWRGIERALEFEVRVLKINCVPVRGVNDDEIPAFFRFARDYPVHVRFIEYMGYGQWQGGERDKVVPIAELIARLQAEFPETAPDPRSPEGSGPAQYFRPPGFKGSIGFISPVSDKFCARCNRMRLTSDGNLKSCLLLEEYFDLKPLLRSPETSDDDIRRRIAAAVFQKAEKHSDYRLFAMNKIGG